ncbi:hypothetical protein TNCV_227231 [Trichonephila clavipes]|nr:hypothetical protein TNCV_227231 [Trichonephila clavipes]
MATSGSSFTPTPLGHEDNVEVGQPPRALTIQIKLSTVLKNIFLEFRRCSIFFFDAPETPPLGSQFPRNKHVPQISNSVEFNSSKTGASASIASFKSPLEVDLSKIRP